MKIHLVKTKEAAIKGYTPVLYSPSIRLNNLESLSDNQGEFILASDLLDDFPLQEIPNIIQGLLKKLRINGTIVIGGTDIRIFCKSLVNSNLNEADAAKMIQTKQSMSNTQEVIKLMQQLGLKIQASKIMGTHYEITAVRN
jgi:hypothetical protein